MFLAGCVSVSYAPPPGASTSRVTVSSNLKDVKNIKVRYQGSSCANYPGQLMAMINSAAVGVAGGNPVTTSLQTGQAQVISVMGLIPVEASLAEVLLKAEREKLGQKHKDSLRELYFAFIPKEGHSYDFKFDLVGNDVALEGVEQMPSGAARRIDSLPLPESCKGNKIVDL